MAEITKTEQGRLDRKAEAQARKQAADERRSSRNEAQQRVDSNITPSTMGQREAAAGLTDTNTTSGRGLAEPTFSQREAAAGLTDTHVGRDDFYTKRGRQRPMWSPLEGGEMQAGSPMEFKAAAAGGSDGGDQDPNQNTGDGLAPFAIKINGAGADTSGGTVIPASTFTIGCNSGDFTITHAGIDSGGTSPRTLGPREIELITSFSGDFPVGDGFKEFIVFGVVVFSKNVDGKANAIVSSGGYNTKIYVRDAEDSSPAFVEGFSRGLTDNPLYMFRIGTVRATKSGSLRRVYVTQMISGNNEIGDDLPTIDTDLFAFKVVDDGDGTVSVTTGTVNTVTATALTPAGKPTELWLKATFADDIVTAAVVATTAGTTSETSDARQIATITWGGTGSNTPTIAQGIKGSQSIASCAATHQWGTLYS